VEVTLPALPQTGTDVSFHLKGTKIKMLTFKSCKSQIRRDKKLKETEERKLKQERE